MNLLIFIIMEDYKKKYKEALGRARTFSQRWQGIEATDSELALQELKEIFPELKESEDERIRKELIRIVSNWKNGHYTWYSDEDYCNSILTWLEKQGEQPNKVSIWKHWNNGIAGNGEGKSIYLVKSGNTYMLRSSLGFECDYIELSELDKLYVEKQGEQISTEPNWIHHKADLSDCSEEYRKAYYDGWNNYNQQHEQIKAEQKPVEWSNEDEKLLNLSLENLIELKNRFGEKYGNVGDCIDWLKFIKERMKGK